MLLFVVYTFYCLSGRTALRDGIDSWVEGFTLFEESVHRLLAELFAYSRSVYSLVNICSHIS